MGSMDDVCWGGTSIGGVASSEVGVERETGGDRQEGSGKAGRGGEVVPSKVGIEGEAGEGGREGSGEVRGERENSAEWSHSTAWARCVLCLRSSSKSKVRSVVVTWGPSQTEKSTPDHVCKGVR